MPAPGGCVAEMPFVGEDRRRIVDALVAAFEDVRSSERPRLVTLEADSGTGKTRMMRELYGRLAREQQTDPPFWPLTLERPDGVEEDVDARRKHISPGRIDAPREARPGFCWLGVSVTDQRYVRALQSFASDRGQVSTFAEVIVRCTPSIGAARRSADELLARERPLQGLGAAAVGEAVTTATTLAGFPVPGAGLVQWSAERARAMAQQRRRIDEAARDTTPGARADHIDRFIETVVPLIPTISEHVPIVIGVEDIHLADVALVDHLVSILNAAEGRVLVVATAWPGRLDDPQRAVARLVRDVTEDRIVRYRSDAITALVLEDRVELARARLEEQRAQLVEVDPDGTVVTPPPIDDRAYLAMAERYRTTPLALEQVCGLRSVRTLIRRGRLDEHEVALLPDDDPADIYASMWADLDEDLRLVLEVCALSTPAAQSSVLSSTVWDVDLALRAGRRAGLLDDVDGGEALARITDFGWIRRVGEALWSCVEPPQYRVARAQAEKDIPASLIQELRDALVDELPAATSSSRDFRDSLVLGLVLEGSLPWHDRVLEPLTVVDRVLERAATVEEMSRLEEARAIGEAALADGAPSGPGSLGRVVAVAELVGRCGNASAAAERLADVLPLLEEQGLADLRNDVALRHAFWLGEAGRLDAAMDGLREIIARCEQLDPHPPQLTEARVALAAWLGDEARPLEAVALLEAVIDDPSQPLRTMGDVIAVTQQLAYWLGESGATSAALSRLEHIEHLMTGAPAGAHPALYSVRQQRGYWLGIRGSSVEAEQLLAGLEQERHEHIGPSHPDTLSTRNQRWSWAARRGAVHEGVAEYRRLARDRLRVLGPDAPPTYGTQNNLAMMLVEAGEYEEAATILDEVARQMSARFTPTHRSAILARANAANLAGLRGDADAALAGLRAAHEDWCSRRGTGTRDELTLRANIAVWLDATGATDEAIVLIEGTLDEQREHLDVDDPDVLITAANLAFIRDREEGVGPTRMRGAAADLERVLGPDAPEAMTAWHDVAHLLLATGLATGEDGARDEAVVLLDDVLTRRTRLLGKEHPDTRATAALLARPEDAG